MEVIQTLFDIVNQFFRWMITKDTKLSQFTNESYISDLDIIVKDIVQLLCLKLCELIL